MSTETATSVRAGEIEVLREQVRALHRVVRMNTDGLTEEDSLIQPHPGGNCLNWVVGHLVCIYDQTLPLVGQEPVLGTERLQPYERGSKPLLEGARAVPFEELLSAWDEASQRFLAGLTALTPEQLGQPAPVSPRNNPHETVRSLLSIISFHQAYHAGQTGLLRRIAGKDGAMK
jgi:hypothetical protein